MKSFSENLTELRSNRRMTQGELAERLGVSRQSVSKWENGESFPDLPKLVQLGDALGVSLDVLCGRKESEEETDPEQDDQGSADSAQLTEKNRKGSGKKRTVFRMLLLAVLLIAGGIAGYLIGSRGNAAEPEKTAGGKIPENLRTSSVFLFYDERDFSCGFCVNYYSRTAEFQVTLTDAKGEYKELAEVDHLGEGWVVFPSEGLSKVAAMKLDLTVRENGSEKTVPIAREIWITRDPGNDEYSVSFSVSQQIN